MLDIAQVFVTPTNDSNILITCVAIRHGVCNLEVFSFFNFNNILYSILK